MIRAATLVNDRVEEVDSKLINIAKNHTWIDVTDPTVDELRILHEKCNIPLSELQHCLDPHERPRVKEEKEYILIIYRALLQQEGKSSLPITFILAKRFLISIRKQHIRAINELNLNVEVMKTLFKESPEFLLYKLVHGLTREATKAGEAIEEELEKTEREVIEKCNEKTMEHVFSLKKRILYARKACTGNLDLFESLIKESVILKEKTLWTEIETEILQAVELIDIYRERLTSITEIYMINTSNKINTVMKSITLIATLLSFPILVTGLYGMNVMLPLENHPRAFWIIVGLIVLSVLTTIIFFKKKQWL